MRIAYNYTYELCMKITNYTIFWFTDNLRLGMTKKLKKDDINADTEIIASSKKGENWSE